MALTISDIIRIASLKERETIDTELKSFRKLIPFGKEQPREIVYEIIAFTNRREIKSINDDGQPDGKQAINIDEIKSKLHNLCFHRVSPVIECPAQFIDEPEGQFFIIYVPKRKGIPHAYVPSRSGSEISSHIYYIRTSHGKKLVSYGQLEWLFLHQNDPNYNYSFRVGSDGAGLDQKSFRHEIYLERYPLGFQELSFANFLHYDSAGYLNAKFN